MYKPNLYIHNFYSIYYKSQVPDGKLSKVIRLRMHPYCTIAAACLVTAIVEGGIHDRLRADHLILVIHIYAYSVCS
jgi:hypothetical protein